MRRRSGRRRRRSPVLPVILIAAAAAAVVIALLAWRGGLLGRDTEDWETGTREAAAGGEIPTVSFGFDEEFIDPQHGYLTDMDVSVMHSSLLPMADRMLRARIDCGRGLVREAGYELLALDDGRLVAQGDMTVREDADAAYAEAEFPTLVRTGTEYMLRMTLKTADGDDIRYYTRIRISDDLYLREILDFARGFSDATFEGQAGRDRLLAYLESDVTVADNTDLGYVDLKNSYRQITWGTLAPERPESVRTTIRDVWHFRDGSCAAAVTLEYEMTAADETGRSRTYAVTEYYLMRQYDTVTGYLLDYYREAEDITPLTTEDVADGRAALGILGASSRPPESAAGGDYTVFEQGGRLWEYAAGRRPKLILLYDPSGSVEGGAPCREQGYQIVSLDADSGEATFAVYGYMDAGLRRGFCGMALYRYDPHGNDLEELFFVESDRPYEVIRGELQELSGVGADGTYYFYYDHGIYAIYPDASAPAVVARGLDFGSFAVSTDGTRVAWAEGHGNYGYRSIRLMDLENDLTFDASADGGEEFLVQGFTGRDLVLGLLRPEDAGTDEEGNAVCPMYGLSVRSEITSVANRNIPGQAVPDEAGAAEAEENTGESTEAPVEAIDLEEALLYQPEGFLIRTAAVDDTHITIYRMREIDGIYTDAGEETLLPTAGENSEDDNARLLREICDTRQTVWYLRLSGSSGTSGGGQSTSGRITLVTADEPEIAETGIAVLSGYEGPGHTWFAYARGRLIGAFGSLDEAADAAYPEMGLVLSDTGDRVWSRLSANAEAAAAAVEETASGEETAEDPAGISAEGRDTGDEG